MTKKLEKLINKLGEAVYVESETRREEDVYVVLLGLFITFILLLIGLLYFDDGQGGQWECEEWVLEQVETTEKIDEFKLGGSTWMWYNGDMDLVAHPEHKTCYPLGDGNMKCISKKWVCKTDSDGKPVYVFRRHGE